jgi:hypothetical protein
MIHLGILIICPGLTMGLDLKVSVRKLLPQFLGPALCYDLSTGSIKCDRGLTSSKRENTLKEVAWPMGGS